MGDNQQHLKIMIRTDKGALEAVKWNVSALALPRPGERIDLAVTLEENVWQGKKRIQCLIEDFRPTGI